MTNDLAVVSRRLSLVHDASQTLKDNLDDPYKSDVEGKSQGINQLYQL